MQRLFPEEQLLIERAKDYLEVFVDCINEKDIAAFDLSSLDKYVSDLEVKSSSSTKARVRVYPASVVFISAATVGKIEVNGPWNFTGLHNTFALQGSSGGGLLRLEANVNGEELKKGPCGYRFFTYGLLGIAFLTIDWEREGKPLANYIGVAGSLGFGIVGYGSGSWRDR